MSSKHLLVTDPSIQILNVVNLSSYTLSNLETQVLAQRLSFRPNKDIDKFEVIKELQLFARKYILKQIYTKEIPIKPDFEPYELEALDTLIELLEENDTPELIERIDLEHLLGRFDQSEPPAPTPCTLKKKSDKFPTLSTNSNVLAFVKLTTSEICKNNSPKSKHDNLSKSEREALRSFRDHQTL